MTQQITDAVNSEVIPAYRTFANFVRTEYAPAGRTTLAITSLPDGEKRYQNNIYARTTTRMTPDEIHQLGLREIDRIQIEMTAIAKKEGFADLASFRASLKTNPKYIPTSAEQILDDFRRYIAQMEPKLSELFTLLPKSPVTVEAIPALPERRTENVPAASSSLHPTSPNARSSTTRRLLTTRASQDITCSFPCNSSSLGCRSSACTA